MNTSSAFTLPSPRDMVAELRTRLPHFPQIHWVDSTESTNADLLALARQESGPRVRPWLLGAHLQSRGRGRAGRTWENSVGANLMFSCAFDIFLPARQLPTLSPLSGLATTEALRLFLEPAVRNRLAMKWPNDVLWDQAKLSGILVEATRASAAPSSSDHHVVIIGIGLNLREAATISQNTQRAIADWTSIAEHSQQASLAQCSDIVAKVAQSLYLSLNHVTAHGFADLPTRYAQVDALIGQQVHIIDNGQVLHTGIVTGINTSGQLLLRHPDGTERAVTVGEVSVRAQR